MERAALARCLRAAAPRGGAGPSQASAGVQLIAERDPLRFQSALAEAAAGSGWVVLADPDWGAQEQAALAEVLAYAGPPPGERGWLLIPTGGTSGRVKWARHDGITVSAAVSGYCAHFGIRQAGCLGLLPLHHVSGLMGWLRAVLTNGCYWAGNWKRIEAGELPPRPAGPGFYTVSLVPTQLHRLLAQPPALSWLRTFDAVLLGGGPAWGELLAAAAAACLPLAPTYGMTETAAMVAAMRPAEFLAGLRGSGTPLPHAKITLADDGRVGIAATSLFGGYFPADRLGDTFLTEDLAFWDNQGQLHLVGRRDAIIISGGEKVDPAEVEAVLRSSGQFVDVGVAGRPDPHWGQVVTAYYPAGPGPDLTRLAPFLDALSPYQRPRDFVPVDPWPRNAQGKLNRAALLAAPAT